jgi:hypothetical protein
MKSRRSMQRPKARPKSSRKPRLQLRRHLPSSKTQGNDKAPRLREPGGFVVVDGSSAHPVHAPVLAGFPGRSSALTIRDNWSGWSGRVAPGGAANRLPKVVESMNYTISPGP